MTDLKDFDARKAREIVERPEPGIALEDVLREIYNLAEQRRTEGGFDRLPLDVCRALKEKGFRVEDWGRATRVSW